jgi:hypothetical protein
MRPHTEGTPRGELRDRCQFGGATNLVTELRLRLGGAGTLPLGRASAFTARRVSALLWARAGQEGFATRMTQAKDAGNGCSLRLCDIGLRSTGSGSRPARSGILCNSSAALLASGNPAGIVSNASRSLSQIAPLLGEGFGWL